MIKNKALSELDRIRDKTAFCVSGNYAKKKINQHCTHYYFNDGSKLIIKHSLGIGEVSYQCQRFITELKINQRGI